MSPEDILIEADKLGLREIVLKRVHELRTKTPSINLYSAYDYVWDEVTKNSSQ